MTAWPHVENIVLILVFLLILLLLDGFAAAWAIVPVMFMNSPRTKPVGRVGDEA